MALKKETDLLPRQIFSISAVLMVVDERNATHQMLNYSRVIMKANHQNWFIMIFSFAKSLLISFSWSNNASCLAAASSHIIIKG